MAAIQEAARIGLEHKLFINVSPYYAGRFNPKVADWIFSKLKPGQVVVEITETYNIGKVDIQHLRKQIAHAKARGLLVALDDFGTGNSIQLLDLEPDFIKIDMSIVQNCTYNQRKADLIRQIAGWRSDTLEVIAEGIEHIEDYYTCLDAGVQLFQGYLISRPGKIPAQADQFFVQAK